jgi:hypothetical protein
MITLRPQILFQLFTKKRTLQDWPPSRIKEIQRGSGRLSFLKRKRKRWVRTGSWVWLLLYTRWHRSVLGAAGHMILTPANQLMVMGLKIWSLSNPGFKSSQLKSRHFIISQEEISNQGPFDHWLNALTNCANRAQTLETLLKKRMERTRAFLSAEMSIELNWKELIKLHTKV